jgi:hypothetical protein
MIPPVVSTRAPVLLRLTLMAKVSPSGKHHCDSVARRSAPAGWFDFCFAHLPKLLIRRIRRSMETVSHCPPIVQ